MDTFIICPHHWVLMALCVICDGINSVTDHGALGTGVMLMCLVVVVEMI